MSETPSKDSKKLVERNEKGQLLPGSILNPVGKLKGTKHLTTKLFEALEAVAKVKTGNPENKTYSQLLIDRILNDAIVKGNTSLIHMIMNYIDGAPLQGIDLTSGGEKIGSSSSEEVMEIARRVSAELKAKKIYHGKDKEDPSF